ncbi:MAG: ATP synthase F1 subunit epsilon [Clostridia bacterium]|nr:ATP synthase F1 subunit epsilon [Clostridia bacterium]
MNEFYVEIITPEKSFFEGNVEAAICPTTDGDIEILKGHQNLVAALSEDEIKLKINGEWKTAVVTSGFFEVRKDRVIIFADYCDEVSDYENAKTRRREIIEKEHKLHEERLLIQRKSDLSLSRYLINSHRNRRNLKFK